MNDSRLKTENDEIRGIVADELRKLAQPEFVNKINVRDRLRVSLGTVNGWIASGKLPAFKVGRRVLIRTEDVDALIIEKPITKPNKN